ncbi:hypothetical protein A8F94_18340 [Bacillus sp. FJAT-27225]|uniref:hypothetical protein n=1 Tax=Bacillus sp. FJAT-27225 TaxID=1743144 RepID=UPI00080C2E6E|nr:hypothetical protein [Bacillus sp. FJAT-27225]OCA83095.1 hypothetical protein A8F94_18340 [Bacillus sp. FJAT-27225]
MKKNTRFLVAGAGIGALLWYAFKPSKVDMKGMYETVANKLPFGKTSQEPVVAKAGLSDPMDIDDNKMVSEGSQYGVQYYNQNKQDEA